MSRLLSIVSEVLGAAVLLARQLRDLCQAEVLEATADVLEAIS